VKWQVEVLSVGADQRPDEGVTERVASHIKEPNMIRTAPTLVVLSALCLIAASPAAAQSVTLHDGYSHDSSKIVTYTTIDHADIDVNTAAGARTLLQQIEVAADAVCGGQANMVSDYQRADYRECRRVAISGAVAKMKSPALTMLAAGRQRERLAAK
jgi:UrcA family protein